MPPCPLTHCAHAWISAPPPAYVDAAVPDRLTMLPRCQVPLEALDPLDPELVVLELPQPVAYPAANRPTTATLSLDLVLITSPSIERVVELDSVQVVGAHRVARQDVVLHGRVHALGHLGDDLAAVRPQRGAVRVVAGEHGGARGGRVLLG